MLIHKVRLYGLIGLIRRAPAFSSTGFQKSHFFATSLTSNLNGARVLLNERKCNIIDSNLLLKQRVDGFSWRAFSSGKQSVILEKNELSGLWENEQWRLVVSWPTGLRFHKFITVIKPYYKYITAALIPWATYSYATGYFTMTSLTATYGSVLIAPFILLHVSRQLNRFTTFILMEKGDKNVMIGYFSLFYNIKHEIVPVQDIILLNTFKRENEIRVLVLGKKSKNMVITQVFGKGCLTAGLLARRAPAFSSAGFQKSFFTTSQTLNYDSARVLLNEQKCNIIESNLLLKQRVDGFSWRAFSTEVTEDSSKETKPTKNEFPGVWENEQWNLVVGFPPGMLFQSVVTKMKFFYKCISAVIIPWATYSYATGYLTMSFLAVTYGSVLSAPLTLYIFSRALNRMTAYILMEKSNENILVGYFSTFLTLKQDTVAIDDIVPLSAAEKMGKNIQGFILTKKSNNAEWFYVPSKGIKIFDKEKAERIFHNLDNFSEEVYKYKKE
uniref:Transmembrane protein 186 n=1 Tax=Panagrolaimus sp. ES5 TaxID=591445 RepID=A0AC34F234_9BILA